MGRLTIPVFLSILSCFLMGGPSLSHAQTDTIRPGQVLSYSEQLLVSADGRFQLGFFNLSSRPQLAEGYIGIWYTNKTYGLKVWIANRDSPISSGNGNLIMDAKGLLKIVQSGVNPIDLNPNQIAPNSIATLETTGNFVVKELNPDGSTKRILWQSFDYPTDTLLPGMKLGINLQTGQKWTLTSSLAGTIPASGGFTLEWGEAQLVMRHRGDMYWVSGVLGSNSEFENVPNTTLNAQYYNFRYVSNENESYFSYSVFDGNMTSSWVLGSGGELYYYGNMKAIIETNLCLVDSSHPGCVKQKSPNCRRTRNKFVQRVGHFSQPPSLVENTNVSLADCWVRCRNDCSCVGFDILSPSNKTGCQFYSGLSVKFIEDMIGNEDQLYYLIETSKTENRWWIWVVIAVAASLVALILGFLCFLRRKRLQREEKNEEVILLELTTSKRFGETNEIGNDGKKGHDLKVFSFDSIMAATDNFSTENKLGQGGFGPVYKVTFKPFNVLLLTSQIILESLFQGKLAEGQQIAVKRLSSSSGQGLVEFKNELILIAKLQHMNLVRVLGCCVKGDEKMLIYEYMPNKSLDFFLFDPKKRELLDWKRRWTIIEGIAQGILYLHKYSRLRIIHRDLKASNILLDDDLNPKISDFGMARIFGRNESEANTHRVVGTFGYMSPEYVMEGKFSEKSDVYSFGVLVLEIVSGRKISGFYHPERPVNLVGYAWELWKEGRSLELMDSTLAKSCSIPQILRCIHVGLLCVEEYAKDRPTMLDVIPMLTNENVPLPIPNQAAFYTNRRLVEKKLPRLEQETCSTSVTISEMDPR